MACGAHNKALAFKFKTCHLLSYLQYFMQTVKKCAALASKDFSDSTQCSGTVRSVTLQSGGTIKLVV